MPKEVKKITLGLALSWILGILSGIGGLGVLMNGYVISGVCLILISLILLPPVDKYVKDRFHFQLSGGLKIAAVVVLFMIYSFSLQESGVFSNDVAVQPTENVIQPSQPGAAGTQAAAQEQPEQKVESATLSIDRVQVQVANLYPTRVTVNNTGDVPISPKFDLYVYDSNGNEVCSGSPMYDEFNSIPAGQHQTGEISIAGCMFDKDGSYTLKVDLLDEGYNKLDSESHEFSVSYWGKL